MARQGTNLLIPQTLVDLFEGSALGAIALTVFLALVVSAMLGYFARRIPRWIWPAETQDVGQEAAVVAAVLGLLALLLGFTFSLALDRYEQRRMLVLQESNAIGTAYLRTQLLSEPFRTDLSATLHDYTRLRIGLAGQHDADFASRLARSDALLVTMWQQTLAAERSEGPNPTGSLHVASINEVIDLDAARKYARMAKVPSAVYAALLVNLMISAAILGYVIFGFWARMSAVLLFVLFTLSFLLIIDIDRPLTGRLREQQTPMISLLEFMNVNPPGRFGPGEGAAGP